MNWLIATAFVAGIALGSDTAQSSASFGEGDSGYSTCPASVKSKISTTGMQVVGSVFSLGSSAVPNSSTSNPGCPSDLQIKVDSNDGVRDPWCDTDECCSLVATVTWTDCSCAGPSATCRWEAKWTDACFCEAGCEESVKTASKSNDAVYIVPAECGQTTSFQFTIQGGVTEESTLRCRGC